MGFFQAHCNRNVICHIQKKMFFIFNALKKYEYELRGRWLKLESDYKTVVEIRIKPPFNNNRINRLIEFIKEFDFEIVYIEGEICAKRINSLDLMN